MHKIVIMNGVCPIPLPHSLFGVPSDFEWIEWYMDVIRWGLREGLAISKVGVIAWLSTVVDDFDVCTEVQDMLTLLAPEPETLVCFAEEAGAGEAVSSPVSSASA